jgi:citrate lyase subunit beta/citryl-CoA lyase
MTIRPRRSMLYMPGSNARALEKAKSLAADALILDLEDAVAPDAKPRARDQACAAARAGGFGRREVILRINALATEWGAADLAAACAARPDGILVPKVSELADVEEASAAIAGADETGEIALWLMIETPLAILNAGALAAHASLDHSRLTGFVLGTNDLAKELHCRAAAGRAPLMSALSTALLAGRAGGLSVIDGVFNDIQDTDGFAAECHQGAELGYDGKTLIHPSQIDTCNRIFAPRAEDVVWARRVIAEFDKPENTTVSALKIEGRMVERLHAEEGRRLVELADAIAAAEAGA